MNTKDQDDIYPIPPIPPEIIEALSNNRLVIFIGAGASRIIGCSGWKELAEKLVDTAYEQKLINYHEKSKIIEKYGPRETITILKKILSEEIYEETLIQSLKGDDEKKKKNPIYEKLFKLRGIYLTTNIDTHFDQYFEKPKIFFHSNQLNQDEIKPFSLFHLHGTVDDFSTVIFSIQEYINHYNEENIKEFLKYIFTKFTVLFIGYSLSEKEILDYVLLKGNSIHESPKEQKGVSHFILLPFLKAERNLLRFEKEYFSELNVSVVPYAIDEKGYDQLYDVIENWEREINRKTSFLPRSFEFIEQNIDHYDRENAIEIFQLIKNDEHFRNHFFGRVRSVDWFHPLKEKGYFSPENAPGPKTTDEEGYYSIPQWKVLPYLERVSQQINVPGNERYTDELLTIIRDVSNYRGTNNRHIDNYRTWWYFVKILLNIPNKDITLEIIDLISIWLDSRFNVLLTGSEIATKLLPKFLPDIPTKEDIQKAEMILDHITAVKGIELPEKLEPSIPADRENPRPAIDKFWLVESFIKQGNAARIGEKCTEKPIYFIADRLKEIFRHRNPVYQHDIEFEDKTCHIAVLHTKDYEFDCSVEIVTNQLRDREHLNFKIVKCKNNKCFVEKIKIEISKSTMIKEIEERLDKELELFYENIFYDYSFIWFRSLSGVTEPTIYDMKKVLTLILRDILLEKARKDKLVIQGFLGHRYQYPLFKRLVLFVISECWNDFKEEFWKIINTPNGEELFDDSNYEPEIYTLLEKNIGEFTSQEKERIKEIIEKGPQRFLPDTYIDYWKQKWYSALKDDPDFAELYHRYRKKTQMKEEISFREPAVQVGPGPPPLTKEEVLDMSNEELAKFLSKFKTKDMWRGPTAGGLSDILRKAVKEQPEKFISDLLPFLNTNYYYVYSILWGVRDAWNNRKSIEWGKLLNFIKQYTDRDKFWEDRLKMEGRDFWDADHRWVAGMVGELIQEGTRDDNWAFPEKYLSAAQEILFLIIDNLKIRQIEEIKDPVSHALNSTFGKTITALIFLAWRIARLEERKGEKEGIKWSDDIRNKYEKVFEEGILEAYTLFGQYLPVLHAIDKLWVEQKIKEFESIEEQMWSVFMSGYLFNRALYHELYRLMRRHYLKAISYPFEREYAEEGVVQHIGLSYLYGFEDFSEDSLFGKMLERWNPSHMQELISFFWMQRKNLMESAEEDISDSNQNERLKNRIIQFWRRLHEKYKDEDRDSLTEDDKKILSRVTLLAVFLSRIDDENVEWLTLSAPYVILDFNILFFIEYLDDLKDKGDKIESSKYIGRIFLKMLDEFIPEYKDENIRSIVEFLYKTKEEEIVDIANEICNIYLSHGLEFLRDIYEEYNSG